MVPNHILVHLHLCTSTDMSIGPSEWALWCPESPDIW